MFPLDPQCLTFFSGCACEYSWFEEYDDFDHGGGETFKILYMFQTCRQITNHPLITNCTLACYRFHEPDRPVVETVFSEMRPFYISQYFPTSGQTPSATTFNLPSHYLPTLWDRALQSCVFGHILECRLLCPHAAGTRRRLC